MSLRLKHQLLGGQPGEFTDLSQYIGGQLKIKIIRRIKLHAGGFSDRRTRVFRGEIDTITVDGLNVEVCLAWVAESIGGLYTFTQSLDHTVSFQVSAISDMVSNELELITDQDESMIFFEPGNEKIIPIQRIKELN